ncbi:MAG TPA: transcriptional regulator [Thermoanaerobaculia bacterium]|nr:transcriptional regulator [Thermoanaerobaculia bacterium]
MSAPGPGGLDELIHAPVRLAAMSILAAVEEAEFTYLRERTGATDGNLGAHLRRLEDAGYLAAAKGFEGRKPVTRYRITRQGRAAFRRYVDHLETLISGGGGGEG